MERDITGVAGHIDYDRCSVGDVRKGETYATVEGAILIGVAEHAGIEIEYLHAGIVRAGERDELFAIGVRRCGSNAAAGTVLGGVVVFEGVRYAASGVGAFLVIVVLMARKLRQRGDA